MMKLSYHGVSMVLPITRKQQLTYKQKRLSRTDPVHGHECRNSLFVAPDDTSLCKPPDLQVHLIDKRSSEHYNRNSAVCHVCFVCCVGGNLKHCRKCLQSYNLQCLDKPHKEKKHIEVSGTRQIPIETFPTSLDEVPSQRDAYGNKSVSQLVMNSAIITADFVRQKSSSAAAAAFERKSSSECDGSSPRLNTSNLEDTDSFSRNNSYEETSPENCSVDHEADLKHSREFYRVEGVRSCQLNSRLLFNVVSWAVKVDLTYNPPQLCRMEPCLRACLKQREDCLREFIWNKLKCMPQEKGS
ncbi:unnamed protein product [Prunus armeniaca]